MLSFKQYNNIKQTYEKIIPYRLLVNNKEIHVNDRTGILNKALYYTDKITLNDNQKVFSIQFTTLNYTQQQQEIYYCLEGYSNDWINTNNFNSITYSNLPSGKYTLLITSKEGTLNSNAERTSIEINVLPPFYKSPLAVGIYIIIILSIIFYLSHSLKVKIKLKEIIKYEKNVYKIMKKNSIQIKLLHEHISRVQNPFDPYYWRSGITSPISRSTSSRQLSQNS